MPTASGSTSIRRAYLWTWTNMVNQTYCITQVLHLKHFQPRYRLTTDSPHLPASARANAYPSIVVGIYLLFIQERTPRCSHQHCPARYPCVPYLYHRFRLILTWNIAPPIGGNQEGYPGSYLRLSCQYFYTQHKYSRNWWWNHKLHHEIIPVSPLLYWTSGHHNRSDIFYRYSRTSQYWH